MNESKPTLQDLKNRLHGKINSQRRARTKRTTTDDDIDAMIQQNFGAGQISSVSNNMISSLVNLMGKLRDGVTSQSEAQSIAKSLQEILTDVPQAQQNGIMSILEQVTGKNEALRQFMRQLLPKCSDTKIDSTPSSSKSDEATKKKKKKKKNKNKTEVHSTEKSEQSVLMSKDGSRPAFCL